MFHLFLSTLDFIASISISLRVAILSIGYADGLVDALRLAKGLEPKM
jgi:hypothetical protein